MHNKFLTLFMNEEFQQAVTKKVNNVLGNTMNLDLVFYNGITDGLPYVGVTLQGVTLDELQRIEKPFVDEVRLLLEKNGNCNKTLNTWKYDYALDVPFLMIRYSTSDEELELLEIGIKNDSNIKNGGIYNA